MDRMFSGGGRESAAPHRVQSGRFPPGPPHAGFCPLPGRPWCQQTRVLRCDPIRRRCLRSDGLRAEARVSGGSRTCSSFGFSPKCNI